MQNQQIAIPFPWVSFWVLYGAGLLCGLAILPFLAGLARVRGDADMPVRRQLVLQYIQAAIVIACSVYFGLKAAAATGLARSVTEGWRDGVPALDGGALLFLFAGVLGAGLVCVVDHVAFLRRSKELRESLAAVTNLPLPVKLLAAVYGGIAEELIMRLGLFSLFAWAIQAMQGGETLSVASLWSVNIVISLLFVAGHLPAMAAVAPLTMQNGVRVLILNFPLSLLFGYCYYAFGLEAAMLTHMAASMTLQLASEL